MTGNANGIGKWISILYRYGQGYISRKLEQYNIGSGQYIYLLVLYRKDGINQEELSQHLRIDKATTAKAVKRLEEAGYVRREVDPEDKRAYKVYITEKAAAVKPHLQEALCSWGDILSSGLTEEEKGTILRLLEKMAENAFAHIKKSDG